MIPEIYRLPFGSYCFGLIPFKNHVRRNIDQELIHTSSLLVYSFEDQYRYVSKKRLHFSIDLANDLEIYIYIDLYILYARASHADSR